MPDVQHIHLVVAYFKDEDTARKALSVLNEKHKSESLPLDGAALIYRDEEGEVHLKEVGDRHPAEGVVKGALIGGALGLLFGPLGAIGGSAIGAYYGGLVASSVDEGVPDPALQEIANLLPTDSSAVVVLTTEARASDVEALLASLGGEVVTDGGQAAKIVLPSAEDHESSH